MLSSLCFKCHRRIQGLFLVGVCTECYDAMNAAEKDAIPQGIWDSLHSADFRAKWSTPAAFDAARKAV